MASGYGADLERCRPLKIDPSSVANLDKQTQTFGFKVGGGLPLVLF